MLAEPFRSVPARLRFGHRSRRLGVTGVPRDALLNRLLDGNARPISLPPEGLLISAKLAEILGAQARRSAARSRCRKAERPVRDIVLAGTFTDYAGVAAYMDIDALRATDARRAARVSGAVSHRRCATVERIPRPR